jgi:hypothetical protein
MTVIEVQIARVDDDGGGDDEGTDGRNMESLDCHHA